MKEITLKELTEKYYSMKNRELCDLLGICPPTLMRMLRENNIPLKGSGNKRYRRKIIVLD